MSQKFYSKDLPAARAYAANRLSAYGYEDEAEIIRKDGGFALDPSGLMLGFITSAVAKLIALWAPVTGAKSASRQALSANTNP